MTILLLLFLGVVLQQPPAFRDTAVIPALKQANPGVKNFQTFLKRSVDDAHVLLIVRGTPGSLLPTRVRRGWWWGQRDVIGVFLMDGANPNRVWELAILGDSTNDSVLTLLRVDASSLVLSREDPDYGIRQNFIKLFFDVSSKRLLKRVDYSPQAGVTRVVQADEKLCATMSTGTTWPLACMQDGNLGIVSWSARFRRAAR